MQIKKFIFPISFALLLSGCSTFEGMKSDFRQATESIGSSMESASRSVIPDAYTGHKRRGVLKPAGLQQRQQPSAPISLEAPVINTPEQTALSWNELTDYSGTLPADEAAIADDLAPVLEWTPVQAPQPATGIRPVAVNDAVSVFPLDDSTSSDGYATPAYVTPSFAPPLSISSRISDQNYGDIVQRLYFGHGSAAIAASDRRQLKEIASGLKRSTTDISVTVVGHASKRVDGVADPVKRKMVNFEMAQKRSNAVTTELGKAGVRPDWVRTVSMGDDVPNPDPGSKSQEEADRRVELYVAGGR